MPDNLQLELHKPGLGAKLYPVEFGMYTIGSEADCHILLQHASIEPRHAILSLQAADSWIEDLDSQTGTLVDGRRVNGRQSIRPGQRIDVGPYALYIRTPQPETVRIEPPPAAPQPQIQPQAAVPPPRPTLVPQPPPAHSATPAATQQRRLIKQQIHRQLVERLDIKRMTSSRVDKDELKDKAMKTLRGIVGEISTKLPAGVLPEAIIKEIYDEAIGLGPLEDLLQDQDVTEIMVNGPNQIYVERRGKIEHTDRSFMDDSSVLAVIERIVAPLGRRIDESQPYVDARLSDGSRVNAIIHPLSLIGPCLTIRKFSKIPLTDQDLIRFGTMNSSIAEFARICVLLRKNIIVSGGTGSGKTTLLNVLSNYIPNTDRIITIEDAAELRLGQTHVVRLEARPPNIEGKGQVAIRDLVRNALRMRPDRIVVGECRGGEALDMLQAMNTGHDGSLTTAHANSPRDVISRLETMVLMSGMDLPVRAIREQIASAVDIIVHESRFSDGSRKIAKVTEIVGQEGEQITMQDIFEFEQTSVGPKGEVIGRFKPTGAIPTFIEHINSRGMSINRAIFDPAQWRE